FVPNLSLGPAIVKSLRPITKLPLEVHLMVTDPAKFVEPFIKAGADSLIFHYEVMNQPRPLIDRIHQLGKTAGLPVSPHTPGPAGGVAGAVPIQALRGIVHDGASGVRGPSVLAAKPGPHPPAS